MTPDQRAQIFLALVVIAPVLWGAVILATGHYTMSQWILRFVATLFVRLQWRTRIPRRIPFPVQGGALVMANHRSSVDPFFLQIVADRPIRWLVAKEYCESPGFGWFLRQCEAIPTNRGGVDTSATKAALRHAAGGGYVGVMPEGRINASTQFMLPCRPGAIVVALKARVPVIPCHIDGAPFRGTPGSPFRMRARVRVRFGRAIDLSPYYGQEDDPVLVRNLLMYCLRQLAQLAGRDDFVPQIAGSRWKPTAEELNRQNSPPAQART